MRVFIILTLFISLPMASSFAEESRFNFKITSNFGNIPIEITKLKNRSNSLTGIKLNKWLLSPDFSSFTTSKNILNFSNKKISKNSFYISINFKY